MSTYAVFGMTKHRAVELARKANEAWNKDEHRPMTPAEYDALVASEAAETMASTRCIQLSEKFDAPQFADEFMKLCAKTQESRSLHVKAYCLKEIDTKTGRKVMHWKEV